MTRDHEGHSSPGSHRFEEQWAARIAELEAQVAGLEQMNTEKAAEIRRLQRGNHPAGRALRSLPPIAPFADALAEALTERDAEHEGGAS